MKTSLSKKITIVSPKTGEHFSIQEGLSDQHLSEIIAYTNDSSDVTLREFTHDWSDGKGRFVNRETAQKWLESKERIKYLLLDESDKVAGFIWFSVAPLSAYFKPEDRKFVDSFDPSQYSVTFAVRTYCAARGARIAKDFFLKSLGLFQQTAPYRDSPTKGIWLTSHKDNVAGISLYKRLGFTDASIWTESGRIIMIRSLTP